MFSLYILKEKEKIIYNGNLQKLLQESANISYSIIITTTLGGMVMNKNFELNVAELEKVRAAGINLKSKYVPAAMREQVKAVLAGNGPKAKSQTAKSQPSIDDDDDDGVMVKKQVVVATSAKDAIAQVATKVLGDIVEAAEQRAFERGIEIGRQKAFIEIDKILDEAALSGKLDAAVKMLKVIVGKDNEG